MSGDKRWKPSTQAGHLGRDPSLFMGAVNTPVFRATTMLFPTVAALEQAAAGEYEGISYGLHGLPTVTDLQQAVTEVEGGHRAFAVPSGLTATTLPFLALLTAGDHVLVTDAVYGPTRRFCDIHLPRLGIEVGYYDPLAGEAIEREFRNNTKLVFTESPGSLTFEVQDIAAIADVAHRRGARVAIDNSWATPFGFRSFDHGVDVSVHAATKYIGGHSDVLLGLILANEGAARPLERLWTDLGVTASSDDCFLGLRGFRTLPLAPRTAPGERAGDRADGCRRGPRSARSSIRRCPAPAVTSSGDATSAGGRGSSRSCSSRWPRRRSTRCSTACNCSAWDGAGAASRASMIPIYPGTCAYGYTLGRGRTVPAFRDRSRGSGGSDPRPRGRLRRGSPPDAGATLHHSRGRRPALGRRPGSPPGCLRRSRGRGRGR